VSDDVRSDGEPGFTAPEKISSVVERVLSAPTAGDPKLAAAMRALRAGRRFGLFGPLLALLPPADDPAQWDSFLVLATGLALNLTSDGVDVDVDQAREAGAQLLAELYREQPA
jgi:hypothetical protein